MSENPARNELASSVSVSGSWRSNRLRRRRRWRLLRYANGATSTTTPPIRPTSGPTITAKQQEHDDRERRRVEEQLRGAERNVGLLEHQLGAGQQPGSLRDARREGDGLLDHRGLGLAPCRHRTGVDSPMSGSS